MRVLFLLLLAVTITFHQNITYAAFPQEDTATAGDEFKTFDENTSSGSDEFKEFNETGQGTGSINETGGCIANDSLCNPSSCQGSCAKTEEMKSQALYWAIGILAATLLAGFLVRFRSTRNFRGFFLISSVFILGFYNGGCTVCPINGFMDVILILTGYMQGWQYLIWFIGVIILTYLFGKVWCGWICHLGAIQEIIYLPGRLSFLKGMRIRRIFNITRIVLLIALIIQLIVMGSKYWCKIDPFVYIFNFPDFFRFLLNPVFDAEFVVILVLVLLLLVSSVFSYRPFCRSMCPVGIILGQVSRLPGASVLGLKEECIGCKECSSACRQNAIIREGKGSTLNNTECIMCGDCIDACNRHGMGVLRKSAQNKTVVDCKKIQLDK